MPQSQHSKNKKNTPTSYFLLPNRGIAALATIVAISAFLLAIGVLIMIQSGVSVQTGQYTAQAERAQFLAETGIQDALIKLARNLNYATDTPSGYTITETNGTITVALTPGSPVIVVSTAKVTQADATVTRVIRAEVTLDSNGKITSLSKTNI